MKIWNEPNIEEIAVGKEDEWTVVYGRLKKPAYIGEPLFAFVKGDQIRLPEPDEIWDLVNKYLKNDH